MAWGRSTIFAILSLLAVHILFLKCRNLVVCRYPRKTSGADDECSRSSELSLHKSELIKKEMSNGTLANDLSRPCIVMDVSFSEHTVFAASLSPMRSAGCRVWEGSAASLGKETLLSSILAPSNACRRSACRVACSSPSCRVFTVILLHGCAFVIEGFHFEGSSCLLLRTRASMKKRWTGVSCHCK